MKRIIAVLIAVVVIAAATIVCANQPHPIDLNESHTYWFTVDGKEQKITIDPDKNHLIVTTENGTYRVYPTGQIDKLGWHNLYPHQWVDSIPDTISVPAIP